MSLDIPDDPDGDVIRSLIEAGKDLSKPIDIEFAVSIPNEVTGREFGAKVSDLGFDVDIYYDEDDHSWTCYCVRRMLLTYDEVIETQRQLEDIGAPFQAKPDGWGTFAE